MSQKGFANIVLVIIIVVLAGVSATGVSTTKGNNTTSLATVTVRTSNGGKTWLTNSTQLISWNSQLFVATFATPTVKIEWVKENGESGVIADAAPATQFGGAYGWIIPNDFPVGTYKIRVTLVDAVDTSDAFFTIATSTSVVLAPTPTPTDFSVKVMYPNGGEKFTGDQTITVSWQLTLPPNFVSAYRTASIEWLRNDGSTGTIIKGLSIIGPNGENVNSYSWAIPDAFPPGDPNFRIRVSIYSQPYEGGQTTTATDTSDGTFFVRYPDAIIAPTSTSIEAGTVGSIYATVHYTDNTTDHKVMVYIASLPVNAAPAIIDRVEQIDTASGEIKLFGIAYGQGTGMFMGTIPTTNILIRAGFSDDGPTDLNPGPEVHVSADVTGERSTNAATISGAFPFTLIGNISSGLSYGGCPGDVAALLGQKLYNATGATVDGVEAPILSAGMTFDVPLSNSSLSIRIPAGVRLGTIVPIRITVSDRLTGQTAVTNPAYFYVWSSAVCGTGQSGSGELPASLRKSVIQPVSTLAPTPSPTPTPVSTPFPSPSPSAAKPPIRLIRFSNNPKVYEVTEENQIKWVPSITVFNQLGLDWKNVAVEPPSKAPQYQRVKLMRVEGDTEVYYITEGGLKRHVPNPAIFLSYGNKWSEVVTVKPFELSAISDNVLLREEGKPEVYKLENGTKRWVKTAEVFNRLGYRWNEIALVNSTELNSYPQGAPIE